MHHQPYEPWRHLFRLTFSDMFNKFSANNCNRQITVTIFATKICYHYKNISIKAQLVTCKLYLLWLFKLYFLFYFIFVLWPIWVSFSFLSIKALRFISFFPNQSKNRLIIILAAGNILQSISTKPTRRYKAFRFNFLRLNSTVEPFYLCLSDSTWQNDFWNALYYEFRLE